VGEAVGWLDGRPITFGDVARYLRTKEPETFARSLEGLVLERVTRVEAGRLGVSAPRALLLRLTEERLRRWEERVRAAGRERGGAEVDPALWLQRTAGVSLAQFRTWVRRHTEVELLQDRLARYELLTSRRVEVSLLVVRSAEEAARLVKRLRAGTTTFPRAARAHSLHTTRENGGRLPFPLLPDDLADAAVRTALFAAEPGVVVGPFVTRGGKESYHQVYRVEARRDPRKGDYARLAADVSGDLDARPVHVGEYERWRRRILLRHGFHLTSATGESG
jgi:hypothetical protein